MNKLKPGSIYQHFKGNLYEIVTEGINTETNEEMVVYRSLTDNKIWIRPKIMFLSKVDKEKYSYIIQENRFELIPNIKIRR